tara:strand:- start:1335 stop:2195 length:861 start_codon:yes stop_codon:yes gene_type:complete
MWTPPEEKQGWFKDLLGSLGDAGKDALSYFGSSEGLAKLGGMGLSWLINDQGWNDPNAQPVGYQGKVPDMTAVRGQVPMMRGIPQQGGGVSPIDQEGIGGIYTPPAGGQVNMSYDPNRRPGSAGRRYFTDTQYVENEEAVEGMPAPVDNMPAAVAARDMQAAQRREQNINNPARQRRKRVIPRQPVGVQPMAEGGIASVVRKPDGMLRGQTDGMADKIPASIEGKQPAALSDGEFVVPADVVSALGNGNSEAGAAKLQSMMDNVRQEKTGKKEQPQAINPNQMLPV